MAVITALCALLYFISFRRAAVHPHFFIHNMPHLLQGTLALQWSDLLLPFYEFGGPLEHRPRFLTYFVLLLDHHLRLWLYQYGPIPPTLSIAWAFHALGAWLLYRLARRLTEDRTAAMLALAVYVSSVGFLSTFGILLAPGKGLMHVVFIGAMLLALDIDKPWRKTALGVLIFAGLFLDEIALFVPLLVLIMVPRRSILPVLAVPCVAFLAFTLFAAPLITEAAHGYRFDYLRTVLRGGAQAWSAENVARNILALFGSAIAPLQIADPMTQLDRYAAGLAVVTVGAWKADRRVAVMTIAFLVFFTALTARHSGWAYGFYYGSVFAVFLSLLIASAYKGRTAVLVLALVMVAVQINNFAIAQHGFAYMHNRMSADEYRSPVTEGKVTGQELRALRAAWLQGRLEQHIDARPPTPGALYLVAELRMLEKIGHLSKR